MMKQKTVDCLRLTALPVGTDSRKQFLDEMVQKYPIKTILRKLQELTRRDYIDTIDGNVLVGVITPKGKIVLENATRTTEIPA
jgi:hypothetical protein